ncbi:MULTISPECIES: penicillin-binding protein 1A [unclassified Acidovorax]|uniref:penicillin-binding protein 1A n=1 Tax=unclassified Acidovorax TaxID=2684926 RepID=UPI001C477F70|nr:MULTISPECIES: transglycosylase domain-containing protein [unclassified Acidovorax]MBV7426629.1 transglycosylase domain-containing protein [Acidovorax sp. sif0732]MBV7447754.1 transglycosylase domain-containing protein [Acidovorax sp. sif0715]
MRTLLLSFQARAAALFRWLAGLFAWMPRPLRRALLWCALALPAAVLAYTLVLIPFTPSISDIRKAKSELPAQLMSVDGKLLAEYRWANREWVELDKISPHVVNALIATEDHRFYDHFGLDWRRTVSSVVHTLRGAPQGGSTITQQLARNLFPEEIGRSRVFPQALTRKLKEAITALKIELSYSKDEILETYLNTVPFLYNAFGIEMAARTYFDKSADKLNVLESATLIGMLKGTAYYNPVLNPERAQARRNTVLSQMVKRGKLEQAQFDTLQKRPLRVNFERQTEVMGPAPHFAIQLRKQLIDWADSKGYSLYSDGLVIRTTIDSRLQAYANQAVARQGRQLQGVADAAWSKRDGWGPQNELVQTLVRESSEYRAALDKGEEPAEALKALLADDAFLQKLRLEKTRVQAGFLAQDPVTGHVLAWVGSRDFAQDPFDHVQAARRQPGSTFKPFVYGAAFAKGASPGDTLMDAAVEIPLGGGRVWRPTDGRPPSDEPMTLADGLALSKNTITAQVMQQVGPARVAEVARALGVRQSPLEEVPSLALGTSPVTLKEMISAYSSIVNLGRYVEPVLITSIEDRHGKVLETFAKPVPEAVFEGRAAQTLRNTMRGAVDRGTATAIRSRYGIQADVAGKTGTTQDNTDGWFILMHARVVAGAWAGFNDGRITLRSDYWGQGARSALPMVGEFMQQAIRAKVIDGQERFFDEFDTTPPPPPADSSLGVMRDWIRGLFGSDTAPPAPVPSAPAAWPLGPAAPRPPGGQGLPPVTTDPGYPPAPAEERVGG